MFKRRKMRFNGEWSLLAGNRVYELTEFILCFVKKGIVFMMSKSDNFTTQTE